MNAGEFVVIFLITQFKWLHLKWIGEFVYLRISSNQKSFIDIKNVYFWNENPRNYQSMCTKWSWSVNCIFFCDWCKSRLPVFQRRDFSRDGKIPFSHRGWNPSAEIQEAVHQKIKFNSNSLKKHVHSDFILQSLQSFARKKFNDNKTNIMKTILIVLGVLLIFGKWKF